MGGMSQTQDSKINESKDNELDRYEPDQNMPLNTFSKSGLKVPKDSRHECIDMLNKMVASRSNAKKTPLRREPTLGTHTSVKDRKFSPRKDGREWIGFIPGLRGIGNFGNQDDLTVS